MLKTQEIGYRAGQETASDGIEPRLTPYSRGFFMAAAGASSNAVCRDDRVGHWLDMDPAVRGTIAASMRSHLIRGHPARRAHIKHAHIK